MALSLLFFVLYLSVLTAIGVSSAKDETEEEFMIAARRVRGLQMIATMTAGMFDGAILAVYIAYVYQYGLSAIWFFAGLGVGFLFLRRFAPKIRMKADELRVYSMAEYFAHQFGKWNGLIFSLILVVQFFGYLVINLILSGKVLSAIFPMSYGTSVVIGGLIVLTYLFLAGFKAVVRTDFFQLMIMFTMTTMVAVCLAGPTTLDYSELDLFKMGSGNIGAFLLLSSASVVVAPDLWQRIFAASDDATLRRGLKFASFLPLLLALGVTVLGMATKKFYPEISPEDALVAGFSRLLPARLREFGMVLLYAVSLSSTDTVAFVVASTITRDLKNYSSTFCNNAMSMLSRNLIVLFLGLATWISISYQGILELAFSFSSLNLALCPIVVGSLFWNLSRLAVFCTLVLSVVTVFAMFVAGVLNPETAICSLPVSLVSLLVFHIPRLWRRPQG